MTISQWMQWETGQKGMDVMGDKGKRQKVSGEEDSQWMQWETGQNAMDDRRQGQKAKGRWKWMRWKTTGDVREVMVSRGCLSCSRRPGKLHALCSWKATNPHD